MGNNVNIDKSRAKKVIEPSFDKKYSGVILPVVFFIVLAPLIWMTVTTLFDAENTRANKPALVILLLGIIAFLVGISFLGRWVTKKIIKVYLYDKGFQTNKDSQEVYYKDLTYFYLPGMKSNTFSAILYGNKEGQWSFIPGAPFKKNAFYIWQDDYIKNVFPDVISNIENGGKEEFYLRSVKDLQKDAMLGVGKKKVKQIGESLPKLEKITVTKDYIAFAEEIYNWGNYKVEITPLAIKISDLSGNIRVNYGKFAVSNLDLLSVLINRLNRN